MAAATLLTLTALLGLSDPAVAAAFPKPSSQNYASSSTSSSLAELALGKVLNDASPVFGDYADVGSKTSIWMKSYPDDTPLVQMNIPGTHDAATWNYSLATQQALAHVVNLVDDTEYDPAYYRCQNRSMVNMLDAGIRAFDLRYAYDVTNTTLTFWHGPGLQSETATVDDVMYGFYHWLDQHPSEAVFLSFQYEGSTSMYSTSDPSVQLMLFNALTSPAARQYILQTMGSIGTLGQARGKITLLKRFDFDMLPTSYTYALPGLHFSPNNWTDNSPNITLIYNSTTAATAYIEDYYQPLTPANSSYEDNIQWKLNATESHLRMAATTHPDSLFWSFASSTNLANNLPVTPAMQALGLGNASTPGGGVNQRLVPFLEGMKGKRLGIVMFDFYETPGDLLPLFLSLLPPGKASSYAV
ncbi:hypothetical protein LTR36_009294 [Oleoguttula mirabilis]|uniref:Phosphatidylinositol-specific phospholipase C X domain-containing protein n=1 Tax=Oleoguttula mirabilis TaxID=1507867 RepID=A0AAV9J5S2_9PEZI|nr:hypothetical protein LTR36_009294 [Oleoguttula mirabilis]